MGCGCYGKSKSIYAAPDAGVYGHSHSMYDTGTNEGPQMASSSFLTGDEPRLHKFDLEK